jgi:hypothetical protein
VTTVYLHRLAERHLTPEQGGFYYGACGATRYAATRFRPTPEASPQDRIATQDQVADIQVFIAHPGTRWSYVTSGDGRHYSHPCTDIPQLLTALVTIWTGCPTPS